MGSSRMQVKGRERRDQSAPQCCFTLSCFLLLCACAASLLTGPTDTGVGGTCMVTALTHASWFSLVDIGVGRGSSLQWTLLTQEKRVEAYR